MRFYLTNIDNEENFGRMGNGIGQVMTKEEWDKLVVVMDDFYSNHSKEEIDRHNEKCEEDLYKELNESNERAKKSHKESSNVYFIRSDKGLVKVGVSKNVNKRLSQLQISSPYKLELLYSFSSDKAYEDEKTLHEFLKDKQTTNEWFKISKRDVNKLINKIKKGENIYG